MKATWNAFKDLNKGKSLKANCQVRFGSDNSKGVEAKVQTASPVSVDV